MSDDKQNHLINVDVNEALRQIGHVLSVTGENIRDWFIMAFPNISYSCQKRLIDNTIKISVYAKKILDGRNIDSKTARRIADKFGVEWMRNASLEEDEDIQKMWATLLANALDPNFDDRKVRLAHIHIIKCLSILDVKILNAFIESPRDRIVYFDYSITSPIIKQEFESHFDATWSEIWESVANLTQLGLVETIESLNVPSVNAVSGLKISEFANRMLSIDTVRVLKRGAPHLSNMGVAFINACISEGL